MLIKPTCAIPQTISPILWKLITPYISHKQIITLVLNHNWVSRQSWLRRCDAPLGRSLLRFHRNSSSECDIPRRKLRFDKCFHRERRENATYFRVIWSCGNSSLKSHWNFGPGGGKRRKRKIIRFRQWTRGATGVDFFCQPPIISTPSTHFLPESSTPVGFSRCYVHPRAYSLSLSRSVVSFRLCLFAQPTRWG